MNNNSRIQIGVLEANSARSCHEAPALTPQFSQQLRVQWVQELSSHHLELDANEVDVAVSNFGVVSLTDEGEVFVFSVLFAQALSDNRWRPDASQR